LDADFADWTLISLIFLESTKKISVHLRAILTGLAVTFLQ